MSNEKQPTNSPRPAGMRGPGGNLSVPGEKPKNFKATWGKLIAYSKPYVPIFIFAVIFAAAGATFSIVGPHILSEITDMVTEGIMGNMDLDGIGRIATIMAILYVAGWVLNYSQGFIMATVTQRVCQKLRSDIGNKINKLPLKYFDKTPYGDILSRVTNDVDMIAQTLNQSIGMLITSVVLFIGSLGMMLWTNWIMALSAVAATVVGFFFMKLIIGKSQKYFMQQQETLGQLNGHIEEMYAGQSIVKIYNADGEARERFSELNEGLFSNAWRAQFLSGLMMPVMMFIGNFGYVVVCIVGAVLVMNDHITFGVIVAFMIYIRLFTQPLGQLAQVATSMQSTAAASERVFKFLEEEELADESDKTEKLPLDVVKGDVSFEHVKFGYDPEKLIIKDFSAHIQAGQKVAIVGPTGAGKTTMVNLLMRFYDVGDGNIKIDGVPTSTLTRENVHDLFCMVLQDTWLFEGTIKENIVYSKKGVKDEDVVAACKAVGVHHFIRTLPKGYDTILDDKTGLSVGQKQLLTIARAMVANAPLLILDEATSSVDTRTEVLIQAAMDKLMVGRTSFVIAHRLSTIRNADMILVMKDGDIIESGNHYELLETGGFYADLYNSQFEETTA